MKLLLALLAAFALAFSPAAASAGAAACGMDRAQAVVMEGMRSHAPTPTGPCCPKDKACAAACALACQAACTPSSLPPMSAVAHGPVRFAVVPGLPPSGVDVRSDTPPPRTTA